jgi:hypothetical protein
MADNIMGSTPVTPTPRRRSTRRKVARPRTPTTGVRAGTATGMGSAVPMTGPSAVLQRAYLLGAKHFAELHGIPWSGKLI